MCGYINKRCGLIKFHHVIPDTVYFIINRKIHWNRSKDVHEHSSLVGSLKSRLSAKKKYTRNNIYCHGPLLHTVQMNKIFEDSKTFVDMKMKFDANTTMAKFFKFMETHNSVPNRNDVMDFVSETFDPEGSEFEEWTPSDWTENPSFVDNIKDENYKKFALTLNEIWKELGRKMKDEVKENQEFYSIIWVPNPVIVPGGRFREFYYWDSYWIVQGLLLSEMYDTVKGMLSNFAYIVEEYGHIPNGGRIYYQQRSQPPLFIPMVKLYADQTKDFDFVKEHITTFDKEFSFWMNNHSRTVEHNGKNYTLYAYGDKSYGPRPESYSEDVESAKIFKTDEQKEAFYSELKAAAESGWDFSSRWFIPNDSNIGNLTDIKTRSIIPVDLNAMIYMNAVILAEWHEALDNNEKVQYYKNISETLLDAVEAVLWHDEIGSWLDYDLSNNIKRDYFFPSNIIPLFAGCYRKDKIKPTIRLVLKYIENMDVHLPGGVPTSRNHTGEQWDFPNAWPPLQHMIIVGLNNTQDEAASRLAYEIAERWVRSNYKAYLDTEAMYEKYDATVSGGGGGGGEYEVQLGFGWSNGVVMDILHRYGDEFEYLPFETSEELKGDNRNMAISNRIGQLMTGIMALFVTLVAGYIGISIYRRRSGNQHLNDTKTRPSRAKYTELRHIPRRIRNVR